MSPARSGRSTTGSLSRSPSAFYKALHTHRGFTDVRQSAIALHHTIRTQRDRYQASPALWAAYIHADA